MGPRVFHAKFQLNISKNVESLQFGFWWDPNDQALYIPCTYYHANPELSASSLSRLRKVVYFYNYGQSIHPSVVYGRMVCLTKPETRKGIEEEGKRSSAIHFPHDDSPAHSTCMWHYAWFWEPISTVFLSHDVVNFVSVFYYCCRL